MFLSLKNNTEPIYFFFFFNIIVTYNIYLFQKILFTYTTKIVGLEKILEIYQQSKTWPIFKREFFS